MKSVLTALMLLAVWGAAALAQPAPPGCGEGATLLNLSERAERLVARDRLRVELRIEATDADAGRLQAAINRRLAAALEAAKAVPAVTTASAGYTVFQEHPRDQPPQWRGTAALSLSGSDAAAVLDLATTLQQQGLVLRTLAYDVTPEALKSVEDELGDTALKRLAQRGERIAATLGLAVERLCDVTVSDAAVNRPTPVFAMEARAGAATSASPPPVAGEAGTAEVAVTVNAQLRLAPRR